MERTERSEWHGKEGEKEEREGKDTNHSSGFLRGRKEKRRK